MKSAVAILAASLCIVAASAIVAPQPVQQGAVVDANVGPVVDASGRQLLHDDDYNYKWHQYSHLDNFLYKVAKFAIKVFGKNEYLLKTVFGSSYHHGYYPTYKNLLKAYYYEDKYHNKYLLLTIYFEYYGHYYTYDFVVYADYNSRRHYYDIKYLLKIIYNNRYLKGKWY